MGARQTIADYWDHQIAAWAYGQTAIPQELQSWAQGYKGEGRGAVQLQHYPDPYVGDLRGGTYAPRVVILGLNPGIGFDGLQGTGGLWTNRIADVGYSRCFARSPAEDPKGWLAERGKASRYWQSAVRFSQRWLGDPAADVHDILNFELYPWYSTSKTAAIRVPADIAKQFIFDPIGEVDVEHVFAFGSDWLVAANAMGLPISRQYQPSELGGSGKAEWKLSLFKLAKGQRLVVSSQLGYSGPPGLNRLELMRSLLR